MRVPAPAIRWPAEFAAAGPGEDPLIVLTGQAEIDGIGFRITALRMRHGLRLPDYREDVSQSVYEETLERMVDDIEDLIDSWAPQLVAIHGASYLLWVVPEQRPRDS